MLKRKIKERSKEPEGAPTNDRLERLRKLFEPSRSATILFMVLLVGGYMVVRITAPSDTRHAQLRFVDNGVAKTFNGETGSQALYQEPLSGTEYKMALRLREAGALGLSVSLSVFAKQAATGNAPLTHRDVIRELITRTLIQPGIEVENGSF